jgi:hypothetical protein
VSNLGIITIAATEVTAKANLFVSARAQLGLRDPQTRSRYSPDHTEGHQQGSTAPREHVRPVYVERLGGQMRRRHEDCEEPRRRLGQKRLVIAIVGHEDVECTSTLSDGSACASHPLDVYIHSTHAKLKPNPDRIIQT